MGGECSPDLMNKHSEILGQHKASIEGLREDVNRHEKVFDLLVTMTANQTETLVEVKKQGVILENTGKVLQKVVDDVEYLKDNAETKATVKRLHAKVEALEMRDGVQAEKTLNQIKWLVISTIIIFILTFIWNNMINNTEGEEDHTEPAVEITYVYDKEEAK